MLFISHKTRHIFALQYVLILRMVFDNGCPNYYKHIIWHVQEPSKCEIQNLNTHLVCAWKLLKYVLHLGRLTIVFFNSFMYCIYVFLKMFGLRWTIITLLTLVRYFIFYLFLIRSRITCFSFFHSEDFLRTVKHYSETPILLQGTA